MSTIKISVDVNEGGRPAAKLLAERIQDSLDNSTAYVPGKKLCLTNSDILESGEHGQQILTMRFMAVSLKKSDGRASTRCDPISGLEEAWLDGNMIGMFANEADAMTYANNRAAQSPPL